MAQKRWLPITALLALSGVALSVPSPPKPPPLCHVAVHSHPNGELGEFERVIIVTVKPDCPPDGYALVRLTSKIGGSLPEWPPGAYTIRPGQHLRRVALSWWFVEWLSASGRPYTVREEAQ